MGLSTFFGNLVAVVPDQIAGWLTDFAPLIALVVGIGLFAMIWRAVSH